MTQPDDLVGAQFTGHPLIDVGLATMTAFAGKAHPRELTAADLDQVADYIEEQYVRPPLKGYLTMAFTANAWFAQDAFNPDKPELTAEQREARRQSRALWAARHLRQWRSERHTPEELEELEDPSVASSVERCVFTGRPAVREPLSGKLPAGRVGRAQAPLLQGDDSINFFAGGDPGVPISGLALLALQALPLGCAKAGVGLVAVHSASSDRLTLHFARRFWRQTASGVSQAQLVGGTKMPGADRTLKTLLVETLVETFADSATQGTAETLAEMSREGEGEQRRQSEREAPASVTAYTFNNGKTVDLRIYHLPLQLATFLRAAHTLPYARTWQEIVRRAWPIADGEPSRENARENASENARENGSAAAWSSPRYNTVYEDLFTLPDQADRFVRTYFLRMPRPVRREGDPRAHYSPHHELSLISWPLVELFVRTALLMEQARIDQMRDLGDRLANYTRRRGGYRFLRAFFTETNPAYLRDRLIAANLAAVRAGDEQLFDLDTYLAVFEEGEDVYRRDWRLARDLVLMRMIDQLTDWLAQHPNAFPPLDEAASEAASEAARVEAQVEETVEESEEISPGAIG